MIAPDISAVALWFLLGMARIVVTSKLAEHRIDDADPAQALANNARAIRARGRRENYDARGQRLLPWYRVVNTSYWVTVAGVGLWAVYRMLSPG